MGSDERETDLRRRRREQGDEQPDATVVRLPRDWLGPRDQLVPFGPRAHAPAGFVDTGSAPAADPPRVDTLPPSPIRSDEAPSAADFWSERSDSLHDVLQVPEAPPERLAPEVLDELPTEGPDQPGQASAPRRTRLPVHPGAAVVLAAVVLAATCVGFAARGGGGAGRTSSTASDGRLLLADALMRLGPALGAPEVLLGRRVDAEARAVSAQRLRAQRRIRLRMRARRASVVRAAAVVALSPASQITTSPSSSGGSGSGATAPASAASLPATSAPVSSAPAPVVSSPAPAAAAATGSGSSGASGRGPVGQGAVVGPADCNC